MMLAKVVKKGKEETCQITYFNLINRSSKYVTMFPDKVLATTKDIITIDLKDIEEIAIYEDGTK